MTTRHRYALYILLSAVASGAGTNATEILLNHYGVPALDVVISANIIGGLFLLAAAAAQGSRGWRGWPLSDWLRLLAAAAATYSIAFVLLYEALARIGASKVSLLGRLEVVFIVGLAVIFFGERWSRRHWLASALALVGAWLVNFDPAAVDLTLGAGEILSLLSALSFSIGIIVLKSLVDRQDGRVVTGLGLLLGALLLMPFALVDGITFGALRSAGPEAVAVLVFRGLLLGLAWVTYNVGMKHLGASVSTVLFLSVVVFTVLMQLGLQALVPGLAMQIPDNLGTALVGGVIICAGVALMQKRA